MAVDPIESMTTDFTVTRRQIVEHCGRLRSELVADANDLQSWRGDARVVSEGSEALQDVLTHVEKLLGQVAESGRGTKRDEQ